MKEWSHAFFVLFILSFTLIPILPQASAQIEMKVLTSDCFFDILFLGKSTLQSTVGGVVEELIRKQYVNQCQNHLSSTNKWRRKARTLRIVLTLVKCVMIQSMLFPPNKILGGFNFESCLSCLLWC